MAAKAQLAAVAADSALSGNSITREVHSWKSPKQGQTTATSATARRKPCVHRINRNPVLDAVRLARTAPPVATAVLDVLSDRPMTQVDIAEALCRPLDDVQLGTALVWGLRRGLLALEMPALLWRLA